MAGFLPGGIGYGRPAGIPDQGGGLFGGDQSQGLGILAASLRDAGAYFNGRPEAAGSLLPQLALGQQNQQRQQLLQGLLSPDPSQRQQAYALASLNGIDTKPFQQQQASQALPLLLQNMQPQAETANVSAPAVSAQLPNLPGGGGALNLPQLNASYDTGKMLPGMNLSDALAATKSPELQSQYAPQIISDTLERQAKQVRPATAQEKVAAGLDPKTAAQVNAYGQLSTISDPNQITNYQQKSLENDAAGRGIQQGNLDLARQRLTYDQQNKAIDPKAVDLGVNYFISNGGKFPPTARSPALQNAIMAAASDRMAASGQSMDDLVQKHQTLAAGTKAVSAFDTGKQGDTVRSLNVSVQHLDKLRDLGVALKNGDINMVNAARQKFAEAFGGAAPTNWDAAKAIVADEVAKGVIGGQTAQSDRETLAATLKNSRSPEQAEGAINTFQDLLGGQLRGLRQQYKSSTTRDDFNSKLFPETVRRLDPPGAGAQALPQLPQKAPPGTTQTKSIGGKSYYLINGQWHQ